MSDSIQFLLMYIGIMVVTIGTCAFIWWLYASITGYFKDLIGTLKEINEVLMDYCYDEEDDPEEENEEREEKEEE